MGAPVPALRALQELAPRGRGVGHDGGLAPREVGEDVALGARVGGVVADHEEVDGGVRGEAARALAVVDGDADRADLPLGLELQELARGAVGEGRAHARARRAGRRRCSRPPGPAAASRRRGARCRRASPRWARSRRSRLRAFGRALRAATARWRPSSGSSRRRSPRRARAPPRSPPGRSRSCRRGPGGGPSGRRRGRAGA
jgi:hypothetical protein